MCVTPTSRLSTFFSRDFRASRSQNAAVLGKALWYPPGKPTDPVDLPHTHGPTLGKWMFPENCGFSLQIIHFKKRVFLYFHHPFWGIPLFLETPKWRSLLVRGIPEPKNYKNPVAYPERLGILPGGSRSNMLPGAWLKALLSPWFTLAFAKVGGHVSSVEGTSTTTSEDHEKLSK